MPPPFEKIAIAGFGLIGASMAMAARRAWPSVLIIAIDRKDVIERAMRMHAADVGGDDLVMAAGADLVVLAAPVHANIQIVRELPQHVPGEVTITDVGSTKRDVMAAAAALPARLRFVGGHPLAGAAVGGLESARPDLFTGRPWLLCSAGSQAGLNRLRHGSAESAETPGAKAEDAAEPEVAERLPRFIEGLGAHVHLIGAEEHDALVAYLSHLPQFAASALMHLVGERAREEGLALAGRGLSDTTRLASSPPDIWRDIADTNADFLSRAIDELIELLRQLKPDAPGSRDALERTFASAGHWKQALERNRNEG
jgi:prephenate dehydrogenase